jgi:hypothetical protein
MDIREIYTIENIIMLCVIKRTASKLKMNIGYHFNQSSNWGVKGLNHRVIEKLCEHGYELTDYEGTFGLIRPKGLLNVTINWFHVSDKASTTKTEYRVIVKKGDAIKAAKTFIVEDETYEFSRGTSLTELGEKLSEDITAFIVDSLPVEK